MSSDNAKMFGCPFCGFRVSPSDEVCSRCGNKFATSTKFECPFCGELVERGALSCSVCHVNYTDFRQRAEARGGDDSIDSLLTEIIRLESASVKREEKKLSCPNCSWLLDGSEEICPKCGRKFDEDVSYQCPVCGSVISPEADRCAECGTLFTEETSTEEERASEHEEATSALDEILTHADRESRTAAAPEAMPTPEKPTSVFDRIATAMKQEPRRREPKPEPVVEVEREPAPKVEPEPVPEPDIEAQPPQTSTGPAESADVDDSEPAPDAPKAPSGDGAAKPKRKTRKLKVKPKSG